MPDSPDRLPGKNRRRTAATRDLALTIRDCVDPTLLAEYHIMIWMGKPAKLARVDGELAIVQREGVPDPTQEEITAAAKWLSDRGWGLPAQSIHLDGHLRARADVIGQDLPLGALGAAGLHAMRDVIRNALAARAAAALSPALIEATATEAPAGHATEAPADPEGETSPLDASPGGE